MAWGIGANDVANAMGTSVGSKVLNLRQALLVASIFEVAGALLAGQHVTNTIRGQIIDVNLLRGHPELLVYGMLASLLAAGTWLLIATYYSMPVSTTHSIVGAIIGFGVVELGVNTIYWHKTFDIGLSWVLTPFISGVIAFILFSIAQRLIFSADDPFRKAKRYVPCYIFFVAVVISLVTCVKGIRRFPITDSIMIAFGIAAVVTLIGIMILRRIQIEPGSKRKLQFVYVERIFGVLMIFTACSMAFAHGSNDVANAIGPLAAVISIVGSHGSVTAHTPVPFWVLCVGAFGIVVGLGMYGYKVIATIGGQITHLTPSRGFAAESATATTVIIASGLGLPVSTTQTLVGAVLGVGFARGITALNLRVIRNIFFSWVITLPAGALFSVIYYNIIKAIFS